MKGLITKIQTAIKNRTTYRTGLLQTKAYRVLKSFTAEGLTDHRISTVEWAFLGLLNDSSQGMKPSMIAAELGVEAPFVTVLVSGLTKRGFLESTKDAADSRSKIIHLTEEGREFVHTVEKDLREKVKGLIGNIPTSDLITYVSVLEKIIANGKKVQLKDIKDNLYE